jgi:molecular chaperone IbpA
MTQFSIHTLNLPEIHRHAIGFDRMFNELNRTFANSAKSNENYPPYNIVNVDDTHTVIEVAVAGFAETELDVELKDGTLHVTGKKTTEDKDKLTYAHKGISTRNFERVFNLSEHVEIRGANVTNGILAIALELVVPEEKKPRKIALTFNK